MQGSFLLRSYNSNTNSPTPSDREMILTEVVLDDNGQAVLDLSHYKINPSTVIFWTLLGTTQSHPLTTVDGQFGTGQIPIGSFQVPISLTSVAANGNVPGVEVPAAGKKALVMLIIDPRDKFGN